MIVAAALVNFALGYWLVTIGRGENSPALLASGYHVLSDCWTSAAVFIGLLAVKVTGLTWIDPLIAIALGIYICFIGVRISRKSLGALVDERDVDALKSLRTAFSLNRTPGIIQLHHVRIMRLGSYHHIDGHVVVPEFWSIEKAHDETVRFEKKVLQSYSFEGEINFHLDPCRRAYCSRCDLLQCPVRQEPFSELKLTPFEELVSPDEPQK
jgi:cation diffusion facilitator family transporter